MFYRRFPGPWADVLHPQKLAIIPGLYPEPWLEPLAHS